MIISTLLVAAPTTQETYKPIKLQNSATLKKILLSFPEWFGLRDYPASSNKKTSDNSPRFELDENDEEFRAMNIFLGTFYKIDSRKILGSDEYYLVQTPYHPLRFHILKLYLEREKEFSNEDKGIINVALDQVILSYLKSKFKISPCRVDREVGDDFYDDKAVLWNSGHLVQDELRGLSRNLRCLNPYICFVKNYPEVYVQKKGDLTRMIIGTKIYEDFIQELKKELTFNCATVLSSPSKRKIALFKDIALKLDFKIGKNKVDSKLFDSSSIFLDKFESKFQKVDINISGIKKGEAFKPEIKKMIWQELIKLILKKLLYDYQWEVAVKKTTEASDPTEEDNRFQAYINTLHRKICEELGIPLAPLESNPADNEAEEESSASNLDSVEMVKKIIKNDNYPLPEKYENPFWRELYDYSRNHITKSQPVVLKIQPVVLKILKEKETVFNLKKHFESEYSGFKLEKNRLERYIESYEDQWIKFYTDNGTEKCFIMTDNSVLPLSGKDISETEKYLDDEVKLFLEPKIKETLNKVFSKTGENEAESTEELEEAPTKDTAEAERLIKSILYSSLDFDKLNSCAYKFKSCAYGEYIFNSNEQTGDQDSSEEKGLIQKLANRKEFLDEQAKVAKENNEKMEQIFKDVNIQALKENFLEKGVSEPEFRDVVYKFISENRAKLGENEETDTDDDSLSSLKKNLKGKIEASFDEAFFLKKEILEKIQGLKMPEFETYDYKGINLDEKDNSILRINIEKIVDKNRLKTIVWSEKDINNLKKLNCFLDYLPSIFQDSETVPQPYQEKQRQKYLPYFLLVSTLLGDSLKESSDSTETVSVEFDDFLGGKYNIPEEFEKYQKFIKSKGASLLKSSQQLSANFSRLNKGSFR